MDSLFETVREACGAAVWSSGSALARRGGVSRESEDGGEIVLRVEAPGRVVMPRVVLYPDDDEWECDCGGREDPCAHVAAAVIALRHTGGPGPGVREAEGAGAPGHLRYRFSHAAGGLEFERFVVTGVEETLFRSTLAAVASGRVPGPAVAATRADLDAERVLGPQRRGRLSRGVLRRLLGVLEDCPDVRLGERAVRTSGTPVGFRVRLRDDGDGFVLTLERDPPVEEELGEGLVLAGGALRELGSSGLSGSELEALRGGWRFPADRVAELVGEVLPSLERRLAVDVETERLPDARREPPGLRLETRRVGDDVEVLPLLVYGDPPRARVDGERLVPLGGAVPLRDRAAEARLVAHLRDQLGLLPGRRERLSGDEAAAFAARLEGFRGAVAGEGRAVLRVAGPLRPSFRPDEADFELRFVGDAPEGEHAPGPAGPSVPVERVLRAWRAGRSHVALPGGGFAPLPADWLERYGERLLDLLAARDERGRLAPAALPDLAALCAELDMPAPPAFEGLRPLLAGFESLPHRPPPADLTATLRPYQQTGVDWLGFLADAGLGGLLADDMGLGKTLQALCALRPPALVVAPTSVLEEWRREAERFRPALRVCVYHGPGRALDAEADATLTTWALLRLDQDALAARSWATIVLDEAQAIKNPDSQVARAAFALRGSFRVALTGTPVENRLEELWSQLHFAAPGLLGGRSDFETRYARPVAAGDAEATRRLRARIRPFVLRRRKSEVARELPPRQSLVLFCELSEEERAVYDAVRAATVPDVVARLREGGSVMAALEALLRLRQASCHAGLVPGHQRSAPASAKLTLLLERLSEAVADGHKALVFSQWTSLLDRVEPELAEAGIAFTRLDGSTRDRPAVVRSFEAEDGPPVLLLSLRAGGTGLTLTAADHVFLLDPWWNPAVEDQAADRAHRIGQTRPVLVHRLVAKGTVEERMLALQERKRELAAAALEEGAAAGALTRDDLLAVLEGEA